MHLHAPPLAWCTGDVMQSPTRSRICRDPDGGVPGSDLHRPRNASGNKQRFFNTVELLPRSSPWASRLFDCLWLSPEANSRRRTARSSPGRRLADVIGTSGKGKCMEIQKSSSLIGQTTERSVGWRVAAALQRHCRALVSWFLQSSPATPLPYPQHWLL